MMYEKNVSQEISSKDNPLIKQVVRLHQSKYRQEEQLFIAQGERTCATLIQTGHAPVHIFATKSQYILALTLVTPEKLYLVPDTIMEKISTLTTPNGLVGVFHIPPQTAAITTPGLVLAQISDPGNMGTLIRSAAAFGCKTVITVESVDPWNPKVVQATAGTIGMINVALMSWDELIAHKKSALLCALTPQNGISPQNIDVKNLLLVVGNEAHGIPEQWLDQCEQKLTLSMPGGTESINAAIAGSIALYAMITK